MKLKIAYEYVHKTDMLEWYKQLQTNTRPYQYNSIIL